VRSDVNLAVLRTLKRLGVEIPYPQQVQRQAKPLPPLSMENPPSQ
jgi:small-conductance mechanosensitive channel